MPKNNPYRGTQLARYRVFLKRKIRSKGAKVRNEETTRNLQIIYKSLYGKLPTKTQWQSMWKKKK